MRILLTGISGQIGGALLPRLSGHDVIAADRRVLDLTQPERIASVLDTLAPDFIINPAAYTAVDRAEDEPALAHLVNASAPAAMAIWAAKRKVPLVTFSTDYVFDGRGTRPWREGDDPSPLSVYGSTKLAGERAVHAAGGDNLVVRTQWIYAATGSNFLNTIVRLARERKSLRVVADQIGAPTSAAVVAHIIAAMLADGIDSFRDRCVAANGVVHVAATGYCSWHEFALAIVTGLRSRGIALAVQEIEPIGTADYPTSAVRPQNSRFDLSRLRDVFGITPPDWSAALEPELDRIAASWRPASGEDSRPDGLSRNKSKCEASR